jgi:hypothetical protein
MHQTLRSFLPHFQRDTSSATTATSIDDDRGEGRTNEPQNISDTNKPWPKATFPVYLNRQSMYSFLPFPQPRVERKISVQLGLMALLLVTLFFGGVQKANSQYLQNVGPVTVATDKPDYAPRSNAVFTGTGFAPGETIALKVKNLFRACNTVMADSSYLPWSVVADASGGFVTNWTVCDCDGDSLRLKAIGQTSGSIAYAYFKDANNGPAVISSVVVSSPSGPRIYGTGGTITYTVTVTRSSTDNNQTATLGISGLPAGITGAFSPASFTGPNDFGSGGGQVASKQTTLTLTTTASASAITNASFTVTATGTNSVSGTGNFTINKKDITGSFTASNKVYDGNTGAIVATRSLSGVLAGDAPNVTLSGGTATFADKNVGTGKIVTLAGATLAGSASGNYSLTSVSTATANISAKTLTITPTGVNKTYDGLTAATVNLSDDRVSGDVFTAAYTAASFNNKNVGTAKPVSVSGISITGADAANYTFNTTATTAADITARALVVSASGINKVYDGLVLNV